MAEFAPLKILGFDHLEFAVGDLERAAALYHQLGFEKAATREILERQLRSYLMTQGNVVVLLSQSSLRTDPVAQYVERHGEGVCNVAFRCEDAVSALEVAMNRGAELAEGPRTYKRDLGEVTQASIKAFGDVRHSFLSRDGNLFAEGFEVAVKAQQHRGFGFEAIDHVTCNVEQGKLDEWAGYYERVFGLKNTRFFDIHTDRSGLYSKVMQSPDGVIKMPLNEPTEASSQIQEFINVHHGPGVQHVALHTSDIAATLKQLRREGMKFLEIPASYYEEVPKRVPNVEEDMNELQSLGILVDGSTKGYLLQIFTQNVVGPFFYEAIQRRGDDGFGEGNFRALFEAIERDQIRRGVMKP